MSKPGWAIGVPCLVILIPSNAHAQQTKPKATVGAYYFRRVERQDRQDAHDQAASDRVCRPETGGGAGRDDTVEMHAEADRLLCRHANRLLAFDWYSRGQRQDDAAQQRP